MRRVSMTAVHRLVETVVVELTLIAAMLASVFLAPIVGLVVVIGGFAHLGLLVQRDWFGPPVARNPDRAIRTGRAMMPAWYRALQITVHVALSLVGAATGFETLAVLMFVIAFLRLLAWSRADAAVARQRPVRLGAVTYLRGIDYERLSG